MSSSDPAASDTPFQPISAQYAKAQRQYQQMLDKVTPFVLYRWLGTAGLLSIFMLRIVFSQGVSLLDLVQGALLTVCHNQWYIGESEATFQRTALLTSTTSRPCSMLYVPPIFLHHIPLTLHLDAHAIYLLNLLLAFLQPKFDPSLQDDLLADEIEGGGEEMSSLPSARDDEFRPFVRRLPEWQFWYVTFRLID